MEKCKSHDLLLNTYEALGEILKEQGITSPYAHILLPYSMVFKRKQFERFLKKAQLHPLQVRTIKKKVRKALKGFYDFRRELFMRIYAIKPNSSPKSKHQTPRAEKEDEKNSFRTTFYLATKGRFKRFIERISEPSYLSLFRNGKTLKDKEIRVLNLLVDFLKRVIHHLAQKEQIPIREAKRNWYFKVDNRFKRLDGKVFAKLLSLAVEMGACEVKEIGSHHKRYIARSHRIKEFEKFLILALFFVDGASFLLSLINYLENWSRIVSQSEGKDPKYLALNSI
jgi:hypothetical protein